MISLDDNTKKLLINLYQTKKICLEGNIIKLINHDNDETFKKYLKACLNNDKENRRKRLDLTKEIQSQNIELKTLNKDNEKILSDLQNSIKELEESKTKIETQNKELLTWKDNNEKISKKLRDEMKKSEQARIDAENAKKMVENDLDVLQKRTQFELINIIVKIALVIIIGVGLVTTILYIVSMFTNKDTQIIGSTWSNMFGILLTNAFSIIGTIMGVKYASESKKNNDK